MPKQEKISTFLTPSERYYKRRRSNSSPEQISEEYKKKTLEKMDTTTEVGKLTLQQLLDAMNKEVKKVLAEKDMATGEDIRGLEKKIDGVTKDFGELKEEVMRLKIQEKTVNNRLDFLETRLRRNNIIIRGLPSKAEEDIEMVVKEVFKNILKVDIEKNIKDIYQLGRRHPTQGPILVEFNSYKDVTQVMKHGKNLKGTQIIMHKDYPEAIRQRRRKLAAVRREILKIDNSQPVLLRLDCLIFQNKKFTWEEERLCVGEEDGVKVLNSLLKCNFNIPAFEEDGVGRGPSLGGEGGGRRLTLGGEGGKRGASKGADLRQLQKPTTSK